LFKSDTIAAISTALSPSGISIVRISGDESIEIANKIFKSKKNIDVTKVKSHTIHYGFICSGDESEPVDEVLLTVMKGPHTYTGEDIVEINCHGGIYVTRKILDIVIANGASLAAPGEFTKRAFLNGRMDLSQAEAVNDIITSSNEYSLKASVNQLNGSLRNKIISLRETILEPTAYIETALDDPEHFDLDGFANSIKPKILNVIDEIDKLIKTSDDGRLIKEGIETIIVGKPNAGKSSLLNALLGEERAIVTDTPGTTRDALSEYINLGGITLHIVDTAGIRETSDIIERMGVEKAKELISGGDLVLFVIDSSKPLDKNDKNIFSMLNGKKTIFLLNKSDLENETNEDILLEEINKFTNFASNPSKNNGENDMQYSIIPISARKNTGIDILTDEIKELFFAGNISFNNEIYIANERQKFDLKDAKEALKNVINGIELGVSEDLLTIDLMDGYESLGKIIGESVGEDLINEIFSKFCVGK
jgi:tRNA modification GTPase